LRSTEDGCTSCLEVKKRMPSINRIRVNNVKYNFGTQQYDDFTMRMYGKNTLYDLANGGGKSILMLLLLQNLIPNCTLDEKQPVEKLFRAGGGNTVIHSLIEWRLDEADVKDGYRYMTTGFCARKAKDAADAGEVLKDTASIEYFNYCIFYKEYNKNDIVNLPLSEGNERITFNGLKNYLKELGHRDMSLEVRIFDKKGEYQRFISGYGLHESHWEIIRGINKTEGHVRTYFETNYKTTRKVVEDLLIEEIIEKAFATKTGRNGEEDTMAETLLDIKDKLNVLAQRKRDIANYDHQIELINVLEGKVNSCIGLYEDNDKICKGLADVYVTGKSYTQQGDTLMEELLQAKNDAAARVEQQNRRLANLRVTRDYLRLEDMNRKMEDTAHMIDDNEKKLQDIKNQIGYKESVNDYLVYRENRRQYEENKLIVENIRNNIGSSSEKMSQYAYNRHLRDEKKLKALVSAQNEAQESYAHAASELEYCKKVLREGEIANAVAENNIADSSAKIDEISSRISSLAAGVNLLVVGDVKKMLDDARAESEQTLAKMTELEIAIADGRTKLYDDRYRLTTVQAEYDALVRACEDAHLDAESYRQSGSQLESIMAVYSVENPQDIASVINGRIKGTITETIKRQQEIDRLSRLEKCYEENRPFPPSDGAQAVINYISTRHGLMAMHGADYLSALPADVKENILEANPYIPYSVVTKGFAEIEDDINLGSIDTGNECVMVYDMEKLDEEAHVPAENMLVIGRDRKFFMSQDSIEDLRKANEDRISALSEEIDLINEKTETYQEDLAFVTRLVDIRYTGAEDRERELNQQLLEKKDELETLKTSIRNVEAAVKADTESYGDLQQRQQAEADRQQTFVMIDQLSDIVRPEEERLAEYRQRKSDLTAKISELSGEVLKWSATVQETEAKLAGITKNIEEIQYKWTEYFEPYMPKTGIPGSLDNAEDAGNQDGEPGAYEELLDISDEQLEQEFMAMLAVAKEHAPDLDDKKIILETLQKSMDRIRKTIEKRGFDMALFDSAEELYPTAENTLREMDDEMARLTLIAASLAQQQKADQRAYSKIEGSIEYAVQNINRTYGEGAYSREDISVSDADTAIANGDAVLADMNRLYKEAEKAYSDYYKQHGFMMDLYKDVKRIVDTNNIDVSSGSVLDEDMDTLRQIFETSLMKYDRSMKALDRAKNEIMRFKGQTADTLVEMGVFEMANTIRQDVQVPDTYAQAKELLANLLQIIEFIRLEKERVEKGIEDMVAIKENFENQCVQRCMDVKTELEKLPKLSRITVGDDVIKMVDLSIPYVKDEFVKQRMSDYIDDIVKGADAYEDERKRIKYIRDCLGLKKLFGVMVTDMNAIKLNLYKRERIKEQSRYLKYEEAVGSTGQSQGIYIQFLVAVINYIAGMYSLAPEDSVQSKTIFIDNPFGAAKDIYIWEPIFAMLAANHVQLIVPARGATPAITGRFDVNYILGQQMVGGRQQTVVVDYTSKTDQEELEYQELSYEQATFDFI
jgi:hypothetical protein